MAWSMVCKPREEGGLSVRDPSRINQASLLYLTWKLLNSNEQWAHICRERFLKHGKPKNHYVVSSIWPGMKQHLQMVVERSTWSVGNGKSIQFWSDKWLDTPIVQRWGVPQSLVPSLHMLVSDCIVAGSWCLPDYLVRKDAALADQIYKVNLPTVDMPDKLCWTSAPDGELTSKVAYNTLTGAGAHVLWAKLLWNSYIPPSRSFITWRLLHNKLPTDENLRKRGCFIVSICCFCLQAAESSHHIFFDCPVTFKLWEWLGKGTEQTLDCSSCLQLILGILGIHSKLVQQVLNSAVVHTIWAIWIERNQRFFQNKKQPMSTIFNTILAEVKLSYGLCLVKGKSAMQDHKVAKLFSIPFKVKRFTPAHEIAWSPPADGIIKINCDGSSVGSHPCGSVGLVIRDSNSTFLGAAASNLGRATPLEAEFCAAMMAMEKAQAMHLLNICLETDSLQVVNAFNKGLGIPWKMRVRWHNCLSFCQAISCSYVHILREGNMVADSLAKHGQGLSLHSTQWWSSPPSFIANLLHRDRLGLPFTRAMT